MLCVIDSSDGDVISMLIYRPGKLRGPHLKERLFDDDTKIAENAVGRILDSIKERDREGLKSVFSKNALTEAEDMEGGIEYLFEFVQGM